MCSPFIYYIIFYFKQGNSVSDREIRSAIMDSIKSEALSIKNDLQQLAEFVCRRMMGPARSHDRLKIISDGDDLCVHLIGNKGKHSSR